MTVLSLGMYTVFKVKLDNIYVLPFFLVYLYAFLKTLHLSGLKGNDNNNSSFLNF